MGTGQRRARPCARTATAALLATLLLGGCGLLGGGERSGDPQWVHDEDLDVYYQPDLATHSPALVEEHLPMLDEIGAVTVLDGQFTDPHGREGIPAQDDYWWQAMIELEPEIVEELIAGTTASDAGGQDGPDTVPVEVVRTELVAPLEERLVDCPGGWVDVTPALTEPGYANRTAAGDMIGLAVVCGGGTQMAFGARDM